VQQMSPILLSDASGRSSDSSFPELLTESVSCTESRKERNEIYGPFYGRFDQNTGNLGRFEQSGHFMHMAQSGINSGDCASG
jgi:hypothetical protein